MPNSTCKGHRDASYFAKPDISCTGRHTQIPANATFDRF
jgi:hypothetical protein